MKNDSAYFVFAPGENHIKYLEAVFDSIARTCKSDYKFGILLPSAECKPVSKFKIEAKIITPEHQKLCESIYYKEGRVDIPAFVYSQLLLPYYFDAVNDFLFMEVDQIVRKDISPLFSECREKNIGIAAVRSRDEDGVLWYPESFAMQFPDKPYFNMGVVYVNNGHWVNNNYEQLCIEEAKIQMGLKGARYEFYAQGAMNCAISQFVSELDLKYNVTGLGFRDNLNREILNEAVVLHWSGSRKPWDRNGFYRHLYYSGLLAYLYYLCSAAKYVAHKFHYKLNRFLKK